MSHTLEECDLNTHYFDECEICGELSQCTCLGAWVDSWEVSGTGSAGAFAYRYQYQEKDSLVARFGYAESRRQAMDRIAHAVICEKEAE